MGLMDWIGIGSDLAKPIDSISNLYTTDKARLEGEKELQDVLQKPRLAQIENNRLMAASLRFFNSGWQPALGWTSGFLVLLYYAPQIIITTYVWGDHCLVTGIVKPFPMKPDDILHLVWLLFGFGGYSLVKDKIK